MCEIKYIHQLFAGQLLQKIKTAPKPRSFGADGDFYFIIFISGGTILISLRLPRQAASSTCK